MMSNQGLKIQSNGRIDKSSAFFTPKAIDYCSRVHCIDSVWAEVAHRADIIKNADGNNGKFFFNDVLHF